MCAVCYADSVSLHNKQRGRLSTAMLCCGLENNGMVGAWHGLGMTSVNQTLPHCVNQMGKTHSKPLAARYGRGMACARHGNGVLCVNRPLQCTRRLVGVLHEVHVFSKYDHANLVQ